MAFFSAASKADFQQQLQTALAQHVDPKILPQLNLFAEQFFGIVALPELTERRMSDLVGSTLASWRLLERFDPAKPEVQVFNPTSRSTAGNRPTAWSRCCIRTCRSWSIQCAWS